jgi:hypothetical protein
MQLCMDSLFIRGSSSVADLRVDPVVVTMRVRSGTDKRGKPVSVVGKRVLRWYFQHCCDAGLTLPWWQGS